MERELKKGNWLAKSSCNQTHCKSCIFHPDAAKRTKLTVSKMNEIVQYLVGFQSSHECHVTKKTCYGALELQAKALFARKFINQPTVQALWNTAAKILNLKQTE